MRNKNQHAACVWSPVFPELYEWWNFKKICGFQETGEIEMA
ncbi:hypothetical protein AB434_1501 [Heyndrickxia coagulans]|uniref:Uncharacterized protein n=1 Tax=Heyndrickxia coagulans TaxID=1398 RepID=A0AAN0WDZ3_HEYCO|nr:hypothetical protein SB48_HM08orf06117 [Heyndrickxia coagulans]AKN53906.1 hypothetical protein AB434_1501 [Heyndrickxia coagulans]